jgi:Cdc6-like AAA superfamily ATPase
LPGTIWHWLRQYTGNTANAITQLKGEELDEGGHYITVWAPRQTGKTWVMREVVSTISQDDQFDVVLLSLQFLYEENDVDIVVQLFARELIKVLNLEKLTINSLKDFHRLFERGTLSKPLILILDETRRGNPLWLPPLATFI